jgi:hypothetical protein
MCYSLVPMNKLKKRLHLDSGSMEPELETL